MNNTAELSLDQLRERAAAVAGRVRLWVNKSTAAFNMGKLFKEPIRLDDGTIEEIRYRWDLGATEKHCGSCLSLNGRVMTASEWRDAGIRPQSPDLECGGWLCDCGLSPTDAESQGVEGL